MFISAGNIIHYNTNYQRLVKAGGFIFSTPVNITIIIVSSIRLIGAPFAAAFFSKEPILEMRITMQSSPLLVTLCLLRVFITGAYSVRFIGIVISFNSKNRPLYHIEEGLPISLAPLLIIFGPAFLGGSFVSGALVWQPASFLYPTIVKYLIFFIVLLAYLLLIACDRARFFKGGEFSLFRMWSLAGFTSSLVNKVVH